MQNSWNVIKDAIGKNKIRQSNFPKNIIYKTKTITDVHLIAKHFNSYYNS